MLKNVPTNSSVPKKSARDIKLSRGRVNASIFLHYVEGLRRVTQRDQQLAPAGQLDWIEKRLISRHQGTIAASRNPPSPPKNQTRTVSAHLRCPHALAASNSRPTTSATYIHSMFIGRTITLSKDGRGGHRHRNVAGMSTTATLISALEVTMVRRYDITKRCSSISYQSLAQRLSELRELRKLVRKAEKESRQKRSKSRLTDRHSFTG